MNNPNSPPWSSGPSTSSASRGSRASRTGDAESSEAQDLENKIVQLEQQRIENQKLLDNLKRHRQNTLINNGTTSWEDIYSQRLNELSAGFGDTSGDKLATDGSAAKYNAVGSSSQSYLQQQPLFVPGDSTDSLLTGNGNGNQHLDPRLSQPYSNVNYGRDSEAPRLSEAQLSSVQQLLQQNTRVQSHTPDIQRHQRNASTPDAAFSSNDYNLPPTSMLPSTFTYKTKRPRGSAASAPVDGQMSPVSNSNDGSSNQSVATFSFPYDYPLNVDSNWLRNAAGSSSQEPTFDLLGGGSNSDVASVAAAAAAIAAQQQQPQASQGPQSQLSPTQSTTVPPSIASEVSDQFLASSSYPPTTTNLGHSEFNPQGQSAYRRVPSSSSHSSSTGMNASSPSFIPNIGSPSYSNGSVSTNTNSNTNANATSLYTQPVFQGGNMRSPTSMMQGLSQPPTQAPINVYDTNNNTHNDPNTISWQEHLISELRDFCHMVAPDGTIIFCSQSVYNLTGWKPQELVGQKIWSFIHPEDADMFRSMFESSLKSRHSLSTFYRFRLSSDVYLLMDVTGAPHFGMLPEVEIDQKNSATTDQQDGNNTSSGVPGNKGAILPKENPSAGTPPSTGGSDSLKRDEGASQGMSSTASSALSASLSSFAPSSMTSASSGGSSQSSEVQDPWRCMVLTSRPYPSQKMKDLDYFLSLKIEHEQFNHHVRYIKSELDASDELLYLISDRINTGPPVPTQNLNALSQFQRNYNVPIQPIAPMNLGGPTTFSANALSQTLLTASQLQTRSSKSDYDSEKSKDSHPTHKRKKYPEKGIFVCRECGRMDSPEWRKGPDGPKSLCNACGLRWAKKAKERKQ